VSKYAVPTFRNKETGELVAVAKVYRDYVFGYCIQFVELTTGWHWTAKAFLAQHERC